MFLLQLFMNCDDSSGIIYYYTQEVNCIHEVRWVVGAGPANCSSLFTFNGSPCIVLLGSCEVWNVPLTVIHEL